MKSDRKTAVPMRIRVEEAFSLLEQAAVTGERCPQCEPFGPIAKGAITVLMDAGRIRSEVYSRNWRRVTILVGPHAGASTAPPPCGGEPWMVNGVHVDVHRARERRRGTTEI